MELYHSQFNMQWVIWLTVWSRGIHLSDLIPSRLPTALLIQDMYSKLPSQELYSCYALTWLTCSFPSDLSWMPPLWGLLWLQRLNHNLLVSWTSYSISLLYFNPWHLSPSDKLYILLICLLTIYLQLKGKLHEAGIFVLFVAISPVPRTVPGI